VSHRVIGTAQHYAWGDTTFIPQLLGQTPTNTPWAELWFGTHPTAPSHIESPDGPLLQSIAGDMKVLVKILACASPLSLQTHPTKQQAERGFAKENAAAISLDDSRRVYVDDADKPEMLVALTPFEALCGFADIDISVEKLRAMSWHEEADVLDMNGIDGYLLWAFDQRETPDMSSAPQWLQRIAGLYPTDQCLRVAPLLHHLTLQPGQALALPAGNLHAYLNGAGLEVMTSSNNVVRAGFTSKHIDVAELLRIVDSSTLENPIVSPSVEGDWTHYSSPTEAFDVSLYQPRENIQLDASASLRVLVSLTPGQPFHADVVLPNETTDIRSGETVWVITQN
jgi:mannose-6-phosphate isomerase